MLFRGQEFIIIELFILIIDAKKGFVKLVFLFDGEMVIMVDHVFEVFVAMDFSIKLTKD